MSSGIDECTEDSIVGGGEQSGQSSGVTGLEVNEQVSEGCGESNVLSC